MNNCPNQVHMDPFEAFGPGVPRGLPVGSQGANGAHGDQGVPRVLLGETNAPQKDLRGHQGAMQV